MKTDKKFYKSLFAIVMPISLQNLVSALVSASDAVMLGFLNQDSLSAVSLGTQVQFVLSLFFATITIGATILSAQYWGKRDSETVETVLAYCTILSVGIGLIFFLAAFFAPELLMRIFTRDQGLIALGSQYLRVVSWSYILGAVSQVYLCIMKASGRTGRSTVISMSAMVSNLILNAIFIYGFLNIPAMGIAGAALATVLARAIELILVLLENKRKNVVRFRLGKFRGIPKWVHKDFWKYTGAVLLNELAWGCGFTMFTVIMGHLGSDAVAANSYANIVKNLIACFCLGIGSGSGIIVGNELGKGDLEKAKLYGGKLVRLAIASGAVSGLLILAVSPLVLRCVTTLSDTAREYLRVMLYICSYYMIGKAVNSTIVGGIFCAGGDTRFGCLCDIITMWVIIVPVGLIAAFWLKLPVLWVYFLLNLDEFIKLPAVYLHYKKYKWVNNITRQESA